MHITRLSQPLDNIKSDIFDNGLFKENVALNPSHVSKAFNTSKNSTAFSEKAIECDEIDGSHMSTIRTTLIESEPSPNEDLIEYSEVTKRLNIHSSHSDITEAMKKAK
jgi:hypothetical protein